MKKWELRLAFFTECQLLYFQQTSRLGRREWDIEFMQLIAQKTHGITHRY